MAPCEFSSSFANPLSVSSVLERSRSGAVRIFKLVCHLSAGVAHVKSLPLWRRAYFQARLPTVRVELLSLWRHVNFNVVRRDLCGFRACRNALSGAVRIFNADCEPSRYFRRVLALAR